MLKNYLLLFSISLIWGSQFLLNKWALESFGPFSLSAGRAVIGALTLSLIVLFQKKPGKPRVRAAPWFIILIAFFDAVAPMFLIAWGQTSVDSGIASILMGTIPVFTLIITYFMFRPLRIGPGEIISVVFGFTGIYLLFSKGLEQATGTTAGALAILVGACSFALAMNLIKKLPGGLSPVIITRDIMIWASLLLVPAALMSEQPWEQPVSPRSWIAVGILGVIGSAFVYILFVILIRRAGPAFSTLANYLSPLVGVFNGVVFLHETPGIHAFLALAVILAGLTIDAFFKLRKRP